MSCKKIFKLIKGVFLIVLIIILVKILIPVTPFKDSQNNNRIQGVWMTHIGTSLLSYIPLMDNAFHQLSRLQFNRVYVDVYNGGVTYSSKYAPRNYKLSFPFTDPLKAAIKEGKRQNLKIYAWYEHGMMMFPNDKWRCSNEGYSLRKNLSVK